MNQYRSALGMLLLLALLATGCAGTRHREVVIAGILIRDTPQQAFLDVWGPPDRTRTESTDTEEKRLEFSQWGGFYGRSERTYEIWEYANRGVTLIFYDRELSGWKTDKTTQELRTKSK